MRVHDPGIGLAVAWARRRGVLARLSDGPFMACGPHMFVQMPRSNRLSIVDRGPVVEPMPLTDTRVAFGIAVAHLYKQRVWLYTEVVSPYRERVESMTWGSGWIDLDPRRWPRWRTKK